MSKVEEKSPLPQEADPFSIAQPQSPTPSLTLSSASSCSESEIASPSHIKQEEKDLEEELRRNLSTPSPSAADLFKMSASSTATDMRVKIIAPIPLGKGLPFPLWKKQILATLDALELMEVIAPTGTGAITDVSTTARPITNGDVDEVTGKERKKKVVYAFLFSCLDRMMMGHCSQVEHGDALGLWKIICGKYEKITITSKAAAAAKLDTLKMAKGENFESYLDRYYGITDELIAVQLNVEKEIKCMRFIDGLGPAYEVLKVNMRVNNFEFDAIVSACTDYEESLIRTGVFSNRPQTEQAHALNGGGERRSYTSHGNTQGGGDGCWTCGQVGHRRFHCPQNQGKLKCDKCYRFGHTANRCRKFSRKEEESTSSSTGSEPVHHINILTDMNYYDYLDSDSEEDDTPIEIGHIQKVDIIELSETHSDVLFSALTRTESENRSWKYILDSGATRHVVSNRSLVKNWEKNSQPYLLKCALNKVVEIQEVGSIHLTASVVINNVGFLRNSNANLISLSRVTQSGCSVTFTDKKAEVFKNGEVILTFMAENGLYILNDHRAPISDSGNKDFVYNKRGTGIPRLEKKGGESSAAQKELIKARKEAKAKVAAAKSAVAAPAPLISSAAAASPKAQSSTSASAVAPQPVPAVASTSSSSNSSSSTSQQYGSLYQNRQLRNQKAF